MKRKYTIKSKEAIDLVFKEKKSVGNRYFAIYFQNHLDAHFKYAISIGKKYGNAVKRNQAKRRIRDVISSHKEVVRDKVRFVVVVRQQANELSYQEIKEHISKLLHKAKLIENEDITNA